mmetsp:Transcript_16185/g.48159  ORF Transcript_16185/g.48159 Transcript_16185/m.48159 type:complete len:534 (-) Transcript_16185:26-1627(-)
MQHLLLDRVVVVDTGQHRVERLARFDIKAHHGPLVELLLHPDDRLLRLVARVLGEDLREAEQRLCKRLDAELGAPRQRLLGDRPQVVREPDLERAGARHDAAVVERVGDGAQAVAHSVLDLRDRVVVGPLDEDGARVRVPHILHKRVLLLAQLVLVHRARVAEHIGAQLLDRVDRRASARQLQPLHVALLGAPQRHDALLGQQVQRQRVDALLVDEHKRLVGRVAHLALEVDDPANALVGVLALRSHKLLALVSVGVEEARVDLRLFVLEGHIGREDEAVLQTLGHARVACAVVQHQPPHECRILVQLVPHVHDLNHVEVERLAILAHHEHRVGHDARQLVSQCLVQLGTQRRARDARQQLAVSGFGRGLERLQELKCCGLGGVKALYQYSWVRSLGQVALRLLHELADQQYCRCRAVPRHVILCDRGARNHNGSGILDLHLAKQHVAVLGQLDPARAIDEHLDGALGTQVGFHDLIQALGSIDVHEQGCMASHDLRLRVELLDGRHCAPFRAAANNARSNSAVDGNLRPEYD